MRMIYPNNGYEQEPGRERTSPYYREQERKMREERRSRNPMQEEMTYSRGGNYAKAGRNYGMSRNPRSAMDYRMENRMGRIGFEYDSYNMKRGRGGTYMHGGGGSPGDYEMGHGEGMEYGLSYEDAEKWVDSMKNADGSKGGVWDIEEIEKFLKERGMKKDPVDVWAGMNALYSDLCEVMGKYYHTTDKDMNFWLEAACAFWLEDDDAVEDKLSVYYDCIVE